MIRNRKLYVVALLVIFSTLAFVGIPNASATPANKRVYIGPGPQNECSIAVNPTKPDNIVIGFNDYTPGHWIASYSFTTDGGTTWTYGGSLPKGALSGNPYCDPWLAFDSAGYLYYVALSDDFSNHEIFVCVAEPDGSGNVGPLGFGNPQIVDDGSAAKNDKPAIAVDRTGGPYDGNIYVVWSRCTGVVDVDGYRIYFRRGTRTGTTITWSSAQLVGPNTFTQGSQVAVGPSGEVYVAYLRMTSPSISSGDAILISKSTNGGTSFSTIGTVVSSVDAVSWDVSGAWKWARHTSFPTLGVSQSTGTVFVAWADDRNGDDDILLSKSIDGGSTWLVTPTRVNDDTLSNGKDQWHPALTVTPGGKVHVIFYDRRDSPANKYTSLYHARSTDEGASFGNTLVTTATTNPDAFIGWASGSLGDYVGIDSMGTVLGETVYITWGDGRFANTSPRDYNSEVFFEKFSYWMPLWRDFILCVPWWWMIRPIYDLEIPIEILRINGFKDRVELFLEGVPEGVEYKFEPESGMPPFTSRLYMEFPEELEGKFELKVIASSDGYDEDGYEKIETLTLILTLDPFILPEARLSHPGHELKLQGHGFTSDSFFDVFFDGKLLRTDMTDELGSFTATIVVPSDTPDGDHIILVKDAAGIEASTTILTPMEKVETPLGAPYIPVGGAVLATDTLELVAPLLAPLAIPSVVLCSTISTIAIAALIAKRQKRKRK